MNIDNEDDDQPILTEDGEPRYRKVNCCVCGALTSYDPTYEDLCYRYIKADNE